MARKFDFDKPFYVQYANTMKLIFTGQVIDYQDDLNVVDQFRQRFPGDPVAGRPGGDPVAGDVHRCSGSISALRVGRLTDRGVMVAAIIGVSVPIFLLAALLLYLFAYKLTWFPNTGYTHFGDSPTEWAFHLILPWISIATLSIGFYSRVLRSNLLDMVNQDFVRTARAKGLPRRRVFIRHVLRNSIMPIITLFGLDFALLLGGAALVTETCSTCPASASMRPARSATSTYRRSSSARSSPRSSWSLFGAIVDVLYAVLDPRIRLSG